MSESQIQAQLIELLLRRGALVLRLNSGRSGKVAFNRWGTAEIGWFTSGAPDLVALVNGDVWFIEVKDKGGNLSDCQVNFRENVFQRDGTWMTSDEAMKELERMEL